MEGILVNHVQEQQATFQIRHIQGMNMEAADGFFTDNIFEVLQNKAGVDETDCALHDPRTRNEMIKNQEIYDPIMTGPTQAALYEAGNTGN
ncbi:hypothetical protein SADUNF_Sadunf09G0027600 [Salix dunnii]|uniref:Uncharacterized protein n=1 Tax=Salix dunnii TaxID=1413687 RepID=A0A835JQ86_9ROSI|nr:hypothetical protein SADUNF_Sadunf09G0027600 [Salix dunnii]